MNWNCLETLIDLHECNEYKVTGKYGMSGAWMPERGLRKGCSIAHILFNVYNQTAM